MKTLLLSLVLVVLSIVAFSYGSNNFNYDIDQDVVNNLVKEGSRIPWYEANDRYEGKIEGERLKLVLWKNERRANNAVFFITRSAWQIGSIIVFGLSLFVFIGRLYDQKVNEDSIKELGGAFSPIQGLIAIAIAIAIIVLLILAYELGLVAFLIALLSVGLFLLITIMEAKDRRIF